MERGPLLYEESLQEPCKGDGERLLVDHGGRLRPFLRGMVVHSLMLRGLGFDEAYGVATEIRDRLLDTDRQLVLREELAMEIDSLLAERNLSTHALRTVSPRIRVTGHHGEVSPFSKGFLSQSLLAAAIDPDDAFDTAREIEGILVQRQIAVIDRSQLRELVHGCLERRFGAATAKRYAVWRRFLDSEKPVIILLGGATGSGKTSLAVDVANRLDIPRVLSTDSIRQVMRITLSPELVPAIHTSSYEAHRVLSPPAHGVEPVVAGFEHQAQLVSVGVRAMLERAVAENASMILDGVSIIPGMLDCERYRSGAHVVFLLVATFDPEAYRARFASRGRESARPPHRYLRHLDDILLIQNQLLELAARHRVPIIENESRDASVSSILRHVTEVLHKTGTPHVKTAT